MWANAQRDGRPAEHRWQSLADAHYYMPCSNAAKTRNQLRFGGVVVVVVVEMNII